MSLDIISSIRVKKERKAEPTQSVSNSHQPLRFALTAEELHQGKEEGWERNWSCCPSWGCDSGQIEQTPEFCTDTLQSVSVNLTPGNRDMGMVRLLIQWGEKPSRCICLCVSSFCFMGFPPPFALELMRSEVFLIWTFALGSGLRFHWSCSGKPQKSLLRGGKFCSYKGLFALG